MNTVLRSKFSVVIRYLLSAMMVVLIVAQSGCVLFGTRSAEEPDYKLLQKEGDFEVRRYAFKRETCRVKVMGCCKQNGDII